MEGQGRVWQTAGGKRRSEKRSNHHYGKKRSWGKSVTSFFVSNLPEGTKAMDLKACFEDYGRVVDSYVAAKKDKAGNSFGFIRFEGVKDKLGMEIQLKDVKLNNARLSVNLAKYDVEGKANREVESRQVNQCRVPPNGQSGGGNGGSWGGIGDTGGGSYRNALLRNHPRTQSRVEVNLSEDAGAGWSLPDEVVIKWKGKQFSCRCKEDGSDWVPDWIGRPEILSPLSRSPAAKVSVPGNHPISNEGEAEGSSVLGDGACMGKVQGNDVSGGPKNPYHRSLLSADKGGTTRAHNSFPGPNLEDIAHNIIGLKSQKRPRVGLSGEDPFHIDRFINASFPAVPDSSRCSTENVGGGDSNGVAIPDLNTSMEESIRARMADGSPNPVADRNEGYSRAGDRAIFIRQEIEETIKLGKELGIEMENNVDQVRVAIMGELEEEVAQ
ncbi:hypothetical protein L1987_43898 [Smallanthus sonchifolius]|uniref:Uncharacterized protein n=1 Tax=Smallanthus sonchifolius TaxID=185202 RepID=A0ACB9GMP6_9ASTR|nr:hypothetical protein L1987_43898 [Smallanthus sonchifolius]